jgi:hypothetical protein
VAVDFSQIPGVWFGLGSGGVVWPGSGVGVRLGRWPWGPTWAVAVGFFWAVAVGFLGDGGGDRPRQWPWGPTWAVAVGFFWAVAVGFSGRWQWGFSGRWRSAWSVAVGPAWAVAVAFGLGCSSTAVAVCLSRNLRESDR